MLWIQGQSKGAGRAIKERHRGCAREQRASLFIAQIACRKITILRSRRDENFFLVKPLLAVDALYLLLSILSIRQRFLMVNFLKFYIQECVDQCANGRRPKCGHKFKPSTQPSVCRKRKEGKHKWQGMERTSTNARMGGMRDAM